MSRVQLALNVTDVDAAVEFYEKLFATPVAILAAKPAHLELACMVVADVVFADGDYDSGEQAFVDQFAAKHHLPANVLAEAVARLRQRKLDEALEHWHAEIVGARLGGPKDGAAEDDPHRST